MHSSYLVNVLALAQSAIELCELGKGSDAVPLIREIVAEVHRDDAAVRGSDVMCGTCHTINNVALAGAINRCWVCQANLELPAGKAGGK